MCDNTETIVLTDANIRNSYIRLQQFKNLLPTDTIQKGHTILLELDGIEPIRTNLDTKKGIICERAAIKHFFDAHHLKPGNKIRMNRLENNHFTLTANPENASPSVTTANTHEPAPQPLAQQEQVLPLFEPPKSRTIRKRPTSNQLSSRANDLDGKEWTSYSISVWKDIRKTAAEKHIDHPAMFPIMLVQRLIRCFTNPAENTILDPFMGSGSTLLAACSLGRKGIGFEVYSDYIDLASQRLFQYKRHDTQPDSFVIYHHDARKIPDFLQPNSVDFCLTSPPYWNILSQRRSADYKQIREYGDSNLDISNIPDYSHFIETLGVVFAGVLKVLKPGKYCVVNVMDLRKANRFYCFHADLSTCLQRIGYLLDDIIIWDRSHEYNNLRPLGYPCVFRINKVHEYLLIFQKPKSEGKKKHGIQNP